MFHLELHPGTSLRFYDSAYCVLTRRDGRRRAIGGEAVTLLQALVDSLGIETVQALGRGAEPPHPALAPAAAAVRRLFQSLDAAPLCSQARLVSQAPGFLEHLFAHRIPILAMLEITYRCNLACRHCYVLHKIQEETPAHVREEDALRTLDAMALLGTLDVTITGGEPTFHKGYRRILRHSKDLHLQTTFKTNGATFTDPRSVAAYAEDPGHETHLSLYGAGAATHDAFTTIPGSFDRTVRALRELAHAGIRCTVSCILWRDNAHEVDAVAALVEGLGHEVGFTDLIHGRLDGDTAPLRLRIAPEDRARLITQGRLRPFVPSPCIAGRLKMRVSAEGKVSICELLPHSLGNAFTGSLAEIWQGRPAERLAGRIIALSTAERDGEVPVLSCPALNLLDEGRLRGRTAV